MTLFQNGHRYQTAISLTPPNGERVPTIEVEMAGAAGVFEIVRGKLDTGASITMLTFPTASTLGIGDPTVNHIRQGTAEAANGESFPYYVHRVIVSVPNPGGENLLLVMNAGFAREVQRDLFGIDWLRYVCVAVDRQQVHLLRD